MACTYTWHAQIIMMCYLPHPPLPLLHSPPLPSLPFSLNPTPSSFPQIPRMPTTVGVLDPPLGNMRLQVVKLASALLARNSPAIANEIVMLDMFNTLIVSLVALKGL